MERSDQPISRMRSPSEPSPSKPVGSGLPTTLNTQRDRRRDGASALVAAALTLSWMQHAGIERNETGCNVVASDASWSSQTRSDLWFPAYWPSAATRARLLDRPHRRPHAGHEMLHLMQLRAFAAGSGTYGAARGRSRAP